MKMTVKEETYDVGVIVGRFQEHVLHDAHKSLIEHVVKAHGRTIIFLGISPLWSTRRNPLDFAARKQMILDEFPDVNVAYIQDVNNDEVWSKRLDNQIKALVTPLQSVCLYGGRESFLDHYHGRYQARELEQDTWVSGTEEREKIARSEARATSEFREGAIWSAYSHFPACIPTVDIAILNEDRTKILLGRKPHETAYRLIGGYAEPNSFSYEEDVRREVHEEAGIAITDPVYIGSCLIDDWRYRDEVDKIKTLLFVAKYQSGMPRPGDDIEEVRWFGLQYLKPNNCPPRLAVIKFDGARLVEEHQPLITKIQNYLSS